MPVHGEYRHLAQHARLAASTGVPRERILICEDGDVVELADGEASRAGQVQAGMVMVDGLGIGDVGDAVLRDRRKLGGEGSCTWWSPSESQTGKVLAGGHRHPRLRLRAGVRRPDRGGQARVLDALERTAADGVNDP